MRRLVILFAALTLVAAACGKDDEPAARSGDPDTTAVAGGDGSTVELAAKDTAFDQTELSASAGPVTIAFDNQDDGITHNLHVTGSGVDEKTEIEAGPTTQTLDLELEAGTYSYVCDVHPQEMKGDLEVT